MLRTLGRQHHHSFLLSKTTRKTYSRSSKLLSSASMSSNKHEYLVILPDRSGALGQRLQVRPEHLKRITARVDSGFWKLGGALLDEEWREGETPRINGSMMMALAESKEEVLTALKEDIYSTSGVWDWEKVTIHPFKSAFIKP